MDYKTLVSRIDDDIHKHIKRIEMTSLDVLLDSYEIPEQKRDLVSSYILDVERNYETTIDRFHSEYEEIKPKADFAGLVAMGILSTMAGALTSYLIDPHVSRVIASGIVTGMGAGFIESNGHYIGNMIHKNYKNRELNTCKKYQDKKREELLRCLDEDN